jgi:Tfp pilus assembly pilus retraction ATPase PilT
MASSNQGQIEVLDEYKKVEEMIHNKTPVIFVTGGGGTGKSTRTGID